MKYSFLIMLLVASSVCADDLIYANADYGISFEYPATSEIIDKSKNGFIDVWFHVVDWPQEYKKMVPKPSTTRPVSGVRLYTASKTESFDSFNQ